MRTDPRDRGSSSPIAQRRLALGMTQKQLAEAVGCLGKDVSRWEHGLRKPRAETAVKIAQALECSVEELIGVE